MNQNHKKEDLSVCYSQDVPLTNLGIQKRNDLPNITDWTYIINLDEYESIKIALYVNAENVTYFDSFGVDHNPKKENSVEIKRFIGKFIGNKNIITNIYLIKAYNSTMCRYFCIIFIDFTLKGKSLLCDTNLLSSNDYENNDKKILKYF